jgi:hypothetical protein
MRFEISERIITSVEKNQILLAAENQFKKTSHSVRNQGNNLVIESIDTSFGSINRSDTTTIDLQDLEDGYLLTANVYYRPSVAFWILLIILLFTYVLWLIPIAFYLIQKNTVRDCIQNIFQNIKNEFSNNSNQTKPKQTDSDLDQLGKLASLRDNGVITEEEFQAKKKILLGL